jgi:inner membrane protein
MEWWHWLLLGLVLVALEMAAAGGFYVIFFGIAAIAIGALHLFDLAGPIWWQFFLFSLLSIASLVIFRGRVLRWLQPNGEHVDMDSLVGDTAVPLDDIAPGAVGRAELRGTVWSARNASPASLVRAQRCTVVAVDRLMIALVPEGDRR